MDCELNILDLVKRLTGQTSVEVLSKAFLDLLDEQQLIESGTVLGIYNFQQDGDWGERECFIVAETERSDDFSEEEREALRALFSQMSLANNIASFNDGKNLRHLIAIVHQESLMGFIVLELSKSQCDDISFINKLAEVYTNAYSQLFLCKSDALTGLLNRGAFDQKIQQIATSDLHRRQSDTKLSTYLAILDIDLFKKINDTYGHIYGDEVLILFARLIQKSFRAIDWQFRYGGEEFVVILNNIDRMNVNNVIERFRQAVASYEFPQVGQVTVSIGYVEITPGVAPATLMDQADQALYYAKQHGRNQSHEYGYLIDEGLIKSVEVQAGDIDLF